MPFKNTFQKYQSGNKKGQNIFVPNIKYARIIIYYDYDGKRLEVVNKIEDLFYPYLNTAITRMNRNSTLCNLEITFPVDMISSICGMILLKL